MFHDEQLEIAYRAVERENPSQQIVHPLGLVQKGPVTYLVATAFTYQDIRIYAVHRIMSAVRTGEPCKRPEGFSLDQYIQAGGMSFGEGDFIKLKAVVSDYLARILAETPFAEDMKITTRQGRNMLSCTVADTGQLLWWIRSLGDEIEVLAPKKLRCSLLNNIESIRRIYVVDKEELKEHSGVNSC